jgi:Activator of Hsp90 ATPase homolog 1-like protein
MTSTPSLPDSFTTTFSVDQSPDEVFAAVLNVRGWWSENIDGPTDEPGELFTYLHQDLHRCTMRVAELTSPTRVVWHVVDNHFNFTDDANEWKGTEIHFDITRVGTKTELRFTHLGLVPTHECFEVCSGAWDFYLQTSLRGLIRTGKGLPNPLEQPAA